MIKLLLIFFIFLIIGIVNSSADSTSMSINNDFYIENGFCPPPLSYRFTTDWGESKNNGWKYVEMPNGTMSYCVKPCPSMYFEDKEWTDLMNMALIVATISFFASLFLIITYSPLLNPNYKNRHTFGILSMSMGIFLIMFTDVYNLKKRFQVGCPEPNRYSTSTDAECIVTGLLFQFGCVSAVFWWTALSIIIYFQITKKDFQKKYDKYIMVGVNCLALAITLIPWKTYGYGDFALGCWILDFNYALACFWIPLSLCLIFSTVMVLMILYEVYKIFKASNQKANLKGHIKPILCLIINCLEFFYVFGYALFLATRMTGLSDNMDEYIKCLFINSYNESGTYECPRTRLNIGPQFLYLLSLRLLGVSGIVFFGINSKVKKIWVHSILLNNRFLGKYFSKSSSSEPNNFSGNKGSKLSSQLVEISFNDNSGIQEEQLYKESKEGDDSNNHINNSNNNDHDQSNSDDDNTHDDIELTTTNSELNV